MSLIDLCIVGKSAFISNMLIQNLMALNVDLLHKAK